MGVWLSTQGLVDLELTTVGYFGDLCCLHDCLSSHAITCREDFSRYDLLPKHFLLSSIFFKTCSCQIPEFYTVPSFGIELAYTAGAPVCFLYLVAFGCERNLSGCSKGRMTFITRCPGGKKPRKKSRERLLHRLV